MRLLTTLSLLSLFACNSREPVADTKQVQARVEDAAVSAAPLPASMKGYELYAWESNGVLRFMLITGTNREKTLAELSVADQTLIDGEWVAISGSGIDKLGALLERVPPAPGVVLVERADLGTLSAATRAQLEQLLRADDAGR